MDTFERPRTLRVKHVSKLLNVPISTVHDWVRTRALPSIKIGNVILIAVDDLDTFLAKHRRAERTWGTNFPITSRAASKGPARRPPRVR